MAATSLDGAKMTISRTGAVDTLAAINAADGNTWANTGEEWVEIDNGGGTTTTASVPYANTLDGQTVPPKTCAIAAGVRKKWGPFPVNWFGAAPVITYSGNTTSVTIGLVVRGS
jgi:hypothetical protein